MTKLRILAIDNSTNQIFNRITKEPIDFEKLLHHFKEDLDLQNGDMIIPCYFLQLKRGVDKLKYNQFVEKIEDLGWMVDKGISNTEVDPSYGAVIEAMSLCTKVTLLLSEWYSRKDINGEYYEIELVLCAQHVSYTKLLKEVSINFASVDITLVANLNTADELLQIVSHNHIDVKDLDIAKEIAA
jgi:hypothetical protein